MFDELRFGEDVSRLIAEVERLRGLIAAKEFAYGDDYCPWCYDASAWLSRQPHRPDCPAFSAPGVVR